MEHTPELPFDVVYAAAEHQVKKYANAQRVPGMTASEIEVEMALAFYKAWESYDGERGAAFDTHWYRCWFTHKSKLIESFYRKKRQMLVATDFTDDAVMTSLEMEVAMAFELDVIPPCPVEDETANAVWSLIARGHKFAEIQSQLSLGRKKFDAIIATFRTDPGVAAAFGLA